MVLFGAENDIRHDKTLIRALIARITGEATHTPERHCVDCGKYVDSVPREIYNVLEATRSASSNRDDELTYRVLKETTITKRQLDLATRMMLEQFSRLSDGDYEQSAMVELFLDCVHRVTETPTEFVPFRERPMHFDDNQTLSLRVVDPIADECVWAFIDDGCNSCCHGEVWRQNAEAKMKKWGLHPVWLHREATTSNGVRTSTTSGKLKTLWPFNCKNLNWWYPDACVHMKSREGTSLTRVTGMPSKTGNDITRAKVRSHSMTTTHNLLKLQNR